MSKNLAERTAHQYLLGKLQARTATHAIWRAWQVGIRDRLIPGSTVPGAPDIVARRMPWD
ncbi:MULTISPECIES: hypothetical protein [Streptomyces]|uniref:Uncharacterized protein n=1 Tax=Streptomyces luteosporeus TaxID=173856 RepID=A0ABP6GCJ4_9ACTN